MQEKTITFIVALAVIVGMVGLVTMMQPTTTSSVQEASVAANLAGNAARPLTPECKDGRDNDGDGKIDYGKDVGCSSKNDNDETNCGDAVCEGGETRTTCSADCGPVVYCGDGVCNNGETCSTCSGDCGVCPPPPAYCGDGTCNNGETCSTCAGDCGVCPPPANSCADSDGGVNFAVQGTVSGFLSGSSYSYTDFCMGDFNILEYYCGGSYMQAYNATCNGTSVCSNGTCT